MFTNEQEEELEQDIRKIAKSIVSLPGWVHVVDDILDQVGDMLHAELALGMENGKAYLTDRLRAILNEVKADPSLLMSKYIDLMPDDLGALLYQKAKEVFLDVGAGVQEFKDENGETFIAVSNIGALGVSDDDMDEVRSIGPAPVGILRRVQ